MVLRIPDLSFISAPMINQSDLPFRVLTRKHNASLAFTQMLHPDLLLSSQEYLQFHQRGLGGPDDRPVVVQLCGDDPDTIVRAAQKMVGYCDGIDINLGCPQDAAREGHYGAYLLGQKDWLLIENIVSSLSQALPVPVSAKLRLCQPASQTRVLAQRLQHAGASFLTLHARTVSSRRRRQGAADLAQVRVLKKGLDIPVVSNGNVRAWDDIPANLEDTGADGVMVGETLLGNPFLFDGTGTLPDPVRTSLEYLDLCRTYPDTATLQTIQTHVRHFIDFQCGRRPWFAKFRKALVECAGIDEIEALLRGRVQRWRGAAAEPLDSDEKGSSEGEDESGIEGVADLFDDDC